MLEDKVRSSTVGDGILYRQWYENNSREWRRVLVALKILRQELFYHLHELRTGGHSEVTRTTKELLTVLLTGARK